MLWIIRPNYKPPETLGHHLRSRVADALEHGASHIGIVDLDVQVPPEFYHLGEVYPDAEIIGVRVVPSSVVHKVWEKTYAMSLKPRIRGGAVVYRASFLRRVGGFPDVITPDTWLEMQSKDTILSRIVVIHHQPLNLRHSVQIQLRDGRSRGQLKYPIWKTVLHSIVRLRPLVLVGYAQYRFFGDHKSVPSSSE